MKSILLLACGAVLLSNVGCIFRESRHGEYRDRAGYRDHDEYREMPVQHARPPEPGVDVHIHAN